jgi:hypothetical protein
MLVTPKQSGGKESRRLAAIDQMLLAAMQQGPTKKREAISRILELVPNWTRGDCWNRIRQLRKNSELADLRERPSSKAKNSNRDSLIRRSSCSPWTPADEDKLLNLAGYEPAKKIAQRLGRSERAVRCRMAALGISGKVTDGWSLRALQLTLRVTRRRLRRLIGNGVLRVRDPRVSSRSLAVLYDKILATLDPTAIERTAAALANGDDSYNWERTANLLGVPVAQVQAWISAGQLRVMDPFVTDRSFEEFCRNHSEELKGWLIDKPTAAWLTSEYGVSGIASNEQTASHTRKHALVIRTCKCGRKIAGNPYFQHVRVCQSINNAAS